MTKAGIMGEMMDDAINSLDDDEVEEEAEEEVSKVLHELTDGLFAEVGPVGAPLQKPKAESEEEEEEEEPELDAMQARLQALRAD
ncbi:hypothetical protein HDV05_004548 [Chytridiales sp. JEL 0842]|nr:hypothetical protein HDV05_004548 [Chytridiales sp. JEL 0842]